MVQPIVLTQADKDWLLTYHPELKLNGAKICGPLRFAFPIRKERISDCYEIEISLCSSERSSLPRVKETGGRIERTPDMHINPADGTTCLCAPIKEKNFQEDASMENFFSNYLVPYFAAQSFFEKNGEWPWGEYEHGVLGVLESIAEMWPQIRQKEFVAKSLHQLATNCLPDQKLLLRKMIVEKAKIKTHQNCMCSSGHCFSQCHQKALNAVKLLRGEWRNHLNRSEIEEVFAS